MLSTTLADQLDEAIDILLADPESPASPMDPRMRELLGIAAELRFLPSPEFKAALKADLLLQAPAPQAERRAIYPWAPARILPMGQQRTPKTELGTPSFLEDRSSSCPVRHRNLAISFLIHAVAVALVLSSGLWITKQRVLKPTATVALIAGTAPPAAPDERHGGGGGGDGDKLRAPKGRSPRFAEEQLTPPVLVVRNEQPTRSAEATVIGPPSVSLPQANQTGDPMAAVLAPPSNGTGADGGIGSGSGGGIGVGTGPGVGEGMGGGSGGGVFRVAGGVSAPRAIYDPEPEYSEEARQAKYQGDVLLSVIVDRDGRTRDIHIARSLGLGLDEKAMEAVRRWRFEPAMKNGQPVAVLVNIEVKFHLY
jgi:periplasmic protein TonB